MHTAQPLKTTLFMLVIVSLLMAACVKSDKKAGGPITLTTDIDKISYSIGTQIGTNFKQNKIEINTDILARAISDVMTDQKMALTEEEMQAVLDKFQTDMRAKMEASRNDELAANQAKASAFLAQNAAKPGITTLPDSLQYEVITEGTGPKPKDTDTVKVHYTGYLEDGTEFDSSYKRNEPAEFPLNSVIPGWTEALKLMKTGAKYKIYLPPQLGYGARGNQVIPPNSLLIFEIELIEIVKK
ncbi:FKBP-type peptidyl-prolyl cis-trans isomerase [bacterium]|nr:FKBP-type peptidyl-prolyl cis-trans isomerase [bacterium]